MHTLFWFEILSVTRLNRLWVMVKEWLKIFFLLINLEKFRVFLGTHALWSYTPQNSYDLKLLKMYNYLFYHRSCLGMVNNFGSWDGVHFLGVSCPDDKNQRDNQEGKKCYLPRAYSSNQNPGKESREAWQKMAQLRYKCGIGINKCYLTTCVIKELMRKMKL